MEQQEINNHFQQPQQIVSYQKNTQQQFEPQRNKYEAEKGQRQLMKNIYTFFPPYKYYFDINKQLLLYKGKNSLQLTSLVYDRQRLSLQRQQMYYRGAIDQFIDQQLFLSYLQQNKIDKGYINKKRNKSIIIQNVLYYANKNTINAIQLPQMNENKIFNVFQQSIHPLQIVTFDQAEQIMQLSYFKSTKNSFLNQVEYNLIIRFSRKVIVYNINSPNIQCCLPSQSQFIDFKLNLYNRSQFQSIEFDGSQSIFTKWNNNNHTFQRQQKNEFKINDLVVSALNIGKNQLLLTKQDGLWMYDRRTDKQIYFNVRSQLNGRQCNRQRFFNSIQLKGHYNMTPYILSCRSRHISIYDIRKPQYQISKILHHCEQSPPQILQFFDGNLQYKNNNFGQNLCYPLISCHSPYNLGSSIFTNINIDKLQLCNYFDKQNNKLSGIHFTLLNDRGKQSQSFGHVYNQSLSCYNYSKDSFSIYKVDSQGSIWTQFFVYNELKEKYKRENHVPNCSQKFQSKDSHENYKQSYLSQYLNNAIKQTYFIQKQFYEISKQQIQENQSQKNINTQNKKKTKQKRLLQKKLSKQMNKKQKSLNRKQQQTQVDDINLQNCQYTNSNQCQQSYSKRKLNFIEINRFYDQLKQKSKKMYLPVQKNYQNSFHLQQMNKFQNFIENTQSNTLQFSYQQKSEQSKFISTFSFHNKNIMNSTILQKLQHEWDN